ncbi:hypothetical protein ACH4U5_33055 [Streptomyces sp. NPDC020858]|uniref:hypothetical protein n=1 Tax=Streptomyces sp. NPDC020858 TaxID=3365097 RepID=UPI00379CE5EB
MKKPGVNGDTVPRKTRWKELPDLPEDHRKLVDILRRLRECTNRTQAGIAAQAFLVASSLSNHLNGGRIPEESLLKAFFAAIQADASQLGTELPCTLEELLELRRLARIQHCDCLPHSASVTSSGEAAGDLPAFTLAPVRATRPLRSRSRHLSARSGAFACSSGLAVPSGSRVPVPPAEGDRPRAGLSSAAWTELETVTRFLAEGRSRDAGFLLWRAGKTLSASQVIEAVASCRDAGLDEAAESVLAGVSERADRQAVLNITAAFQGAGRHQDVRFLLSAAST